MFYSKVRYIQKYYKPKVSASGWVKSQFFYVKKARNMFCCYFIMSCFCFLFLFSFWYFEGVQFKSDILFQSESSLASLKQIQSVYRYFVFFNCFVHLYVAIHALSYKHGLKVDFTTNKFENRVKKITSASD